jgi:hypothetical protein
MRPGFEPQRREGRKEIVADVMRWCRRLTAEQIGDLTIACR